MAKFGFLSVLEEEMDRYFDYDYAIDWNKSNHTIVVSFILEVANQSALEIMDDEGEVSKEDIVFEDEVLFYRQDRSQFDEEAYLASLAFDAKKGLSREFLAYFAQFLNARARRGQDELLAFLADEHRTDFSLDWDSQAFAKGLAALTETDFFPYPRY